MLKINRYTLAFLLFFIGLGELSFAQTDNIIKFYKLKNDAEFKLLIDKDTTGLVTFYQAVVNNDIPYTPMLDLDFPSNVGALFAFNQIELAQKMLVKQIEMGIRLEQINHYAKKNKNFNNLILHKNATKILEQYDSLNRLYSSNLNLDFSFEILSIATRDHFCRDLNYDNFVKDWQHQTDVSKNLGNELIKYVDSLNASSFYTFINENGFPIFANVGQNSTYIIVLMHNFSSCQDYVIDEKSYYRFIDSTLMNQVRLGNFPNTTYAYLSDRSRSDLCHLPLIYGSRTYMEKNNNILDIKNIDKRRAEIFMPPLWVDALLYGYKLPEDYPIPPDCPSYKKGTKK